MSAQQSGSRQADRASIDGTVRDSAGKPVDRASVRLEQAGQPGASTSTSAEGAFVFTGVKPGSYQVIAEKDGLHSRVVTITASAQSVAAQVDLTIAAAHDSSGPPLDGAAMAFADKPNFTVAGITDWTAVGGHGSDASLRTSESLARETASLKPNEPGASSAGPVRAGKTEAKLRAALAAAPDSFTANHQMGAFCLRAGSYREAIPLLETAYRIDPANTTNEYDLALAYKEAGDFHQAREHTQKLLAREDNASLHRLAGDLDEAQGDSVSAEHEYEQAARLDPSEQNYFAWGSELLLHRAVWPAAEVFRKGSELHPKSARMLAALGAALFASALYDEAAQKLCAASDLNPMDPAPYIFLGKIDMAAPTPLDCVEGKLKRFAEQQPEDARANYYYAMALWNRHKALENAPEMQMVQSLLTKSVNDDPKYGEAYLQLGILYDGEHNSDKAIGYYTKAIEAEPQLSDAHYRLAVAYERKGEQEKAKQEFARHDEIEKAQAAVVERQRQEVKQFMVVLQGKPAVP